MNTAQVKEEYQNFSYGYIDHSEALRDFSTFTPTRIKHVRAQLTGKYEIIRKGISNGHNIYKLKLLLPETTKTHWFPEKALKNIKFEEISIEYIEKKLLDKPEIRLERTLKKRKKSLEYFLWECIKDHVRTKDTIYTDSKKVQTERGARRSLGDLFRLCHYYYPDCSVKDVAHLLYIDFPKSRKNLRSSYCSGTNKRMFYYNGNSGSIYNKSHSDEFGKNWKQWLNLLKK